jgi:hypothetical protein
VIYSGRWGYACCELRGLLGMPGFPPFELIEKPCFDVTEPVKYILAVLYTWVQKRDAIRGWASVKSDEQFRQEV